MKNQEVLGKQDYEGISIRTHRDSYLTCPKIRVSQSAQETGNRKQEVLRRQVFDNIINQLVSYIGEINMKEFKIFSNPSAIYEQKTIVDNELVHLRRLVKTLNRLATISAKYKHREDDEVFIASSTPGNPEVTFGLIRAALEEVTLIEKSQNKTFRDCHRKLQEMPKDFIMGRHYD